MQGIFSNKLSRKDHVILENLVFDMVEGKIPAELIVSDDLAEKIKGHWLYQATTISEKGEAMIDEHLFDKYDTVEIDR